MAMFENFPYTDMHNLNLDWIIKIAKDFLDQYTHIQQIISDGEQSIRDLTDESLQELDEKAADLQALLQQWYDTHSDDIANQLRDALASIDSQLMAAISAFNTNAADKAQEAIDSIPEDYTALAQDVQRIIDDDKTNIISTYYQGGFSNAGMGNTVSEYQLNTLTTRIRNIAGNSGADEAYKVVGGGHIKITPKAGYMYAVQIIDGVSRVGVLNFESRITAFEYTQNSDYYITIWIGKIDNSAIVPEEGKNVQIEFITNAKSDIDDLYMKIKTIKNQMDNTIFENAFRWPSEYALPLPASFSTYPFYVYLSKAGTSYGYRFDRKMLHRNQSVNYKTYYVATDGDDDNSGTSPLAPFKTLDKAFTMTDIGTLILAEGRYIKSEHWHDITITQPVNIIGNGVVILDAKTASSMPLEIEASCYIENICFYRGTTNLNVTLTSEKTAIFNKCVFLDSLYNMALQALGGNYIMLNCAVVGAAKDGFNYHANGSVPVNVLEIECFGYNCGVTSSEITHNASTIHDTGSRIIRIGCEYHTTKGVVIADADNAESVNVLCSAYSTIPTTDARSGNYGAFDGAVMYLYTCDSCGSLHDIISDYATINTTETYSKEHAINSGVINHI